MPREGYQEDLAELREDVLYMSEVVLDRVRMGLDALNRKDEQTAREVIDGDDEINQLYLELERECVDLIALQQPVAGDLRFIAASFKILTDLERIADLAVNLGEYTFEADRDAYPGVDVQSIGDDVVEMVEDAMTAYETDDSALCAALAERDDEIDRRCAEASDVVVRDLIERQVDVEVGDEDIEELMNDVS
ncbi:MAG: phosphate signaling complex protein PhoU, partial [Halococcoides sp.]